MQEISVKTLSELLTSGADIQLIDVREEHEREAAHIGGLHIPMGELTSRLSELNPDKETVVYCRSGGRSASVVQFLEQRGFSHVLNLRGGILAWQSEIDNSLQVF